MRFFIHGLILLTSAAAASAETRYLDEDLHFAATPDASGYQVEWPPTKGDKGYEVTVKKPDGSVHFQAHLQDPNITEPFTRENWTGPYTYFNSNGTLRQKGVLDSQGHGIGFVYKYTEEGIPESVLRYMNDGRILDVKSFYSTGKLQQEHRDFDGENYATIVGLNPDGSVESKSFHRVDNGIDKWVLQEFDAQGVLKEFTETYRAGTSHEDVYYGNGKPKRLTTTDSKTLIKTVRKFDPDGAQVGFSRSVDYKPDGEQWEVEGNLKTVSHYKAGNLEGEQKTLKDGKIISYSRYSDGKKMGKSFSTEEDGVHVLIENADGSSRSYQVSPDYVHYGDNPMPSFDVPSPPQRRTMPPVGSQWVYTTDGVQRSTLKLEGIEGDEVHYNQFTESLGRYAAFERLKGKHVLNFPLTLGKSWSDEYQGRVQVPARSPWSYDYHAKSYSYINGIEKLNVGGGQYDTWVIERNVIWTKTATLTKQQKEYGLECATPSCSVEGYTREVIWYAPEIGRAVLKTVVVDGSGSGMVMHMDGKTMLRTRGILSAELVSFRKGKDGKVIEGPARIVQDTDGQNLAHNFPRLMNNTLEFLMIRHVWLE